MRLQCFYDCKWQKGSGFERTTSINVNENVKHPFFNTLKGNCSGKKIYFFIPSIDRLCGSDAQEKKSDFLHGSVRRYKTLRSRTNCGCGH